MIDEPRVTVSLPRTFRCWVCALAETAHRIPVRCNGGSDGHTNRDGSHRRYPAQFRCEERGRALKAEKRFRESTGAGFTAAIRTASGEAVVKRTFDPNAEESFFFRGSSAVNIGYV